MNTPNTHRTVARLALILPLIAIALAGCKPKPQAQQRPVPEVATFVVAPQHVLLTTELPGRTSPYRIAEVRPQVNGLIQKRLFTEGADVKEGDPLYQIDPSQYEAVLNNAKAALARSDANLPAARLRAERYEQALKDRAVSKQDYDDAAAGLKQAEADVQFYKAMVETAKINLGYALVKSPIPGRVGASTVTDGAIVTAYQPVALATIQQLDPIYVDVPQSATEMLRLREKLAKGQISREEDRLRGVELYLSDGTKYAKEGELQFRDVSVEPTMGTVTFRMVFPNPDKILLPGMFVRAVIKEGVKENAILVPQQTVSRDPKGNPIALAVNGEGKVEQRMLTVDRAMGNKWLVTSGLKAGDHVIAEGAQKVKPGEPAKEVPFKAE